MMGTTMPRASLDRAENSSAEALDTNSVGKEFGLQHPAAAPGGRPAGKPPWKDLGALSDRELLLGVERLCATERETTLKILLFLVEIDRRRLYLPLGYGSLFEFCRGRLGYSESAAVRRIAVTRCIRDFPRVYDLLSCGRVNFSAIEHISRVITAANAAELLSQAEGLSQREVDSLIARLRPQGAIRERVRPVWVRTELLVECGREDGPNREEGPIKEDGPGREGRPDTECGPENEFGREIGPGRTIEPGLKTAAGADSIFTGGSGVAEIPVFPADLRKVTSASGGKNLVTSGQAAERHVVLEQRYKLEFGVEPEFLEKLEQVRALLSGKYHGKLELGRLIEIMMDEYLERHSPQGRIRRRAERGKRDAARREAELENAAQKKKTAREKETSARRTETSAGTGKADNKNQPRSKSSAGKDKNDAASSRNASSEDGSPRDSFPKADSRHANPRHIPSAVRDKIWSRDKGRCTFVSAGGRRCNSRHDLEIDHIVPVARGGKSTPDNLRLLCSRHNRLEAKRAFGEEHMARFRGS